MDTNGQSFVPRLPIIRSLVIAIGTMGFFVGGCFVDRDVASCADSYPQTFFNHSELDFLRARLDQAPYDDILDNILDVANQSAAPRIHRSYTMADLEYLYRRSGNGGQWGHDSADGMHLGMAYQLTGNTAYRDKAIAAVRNIVRYIDPAPVAQTWWYVIMADLMVLRTLITFDLVRDGMSDQDVDSALVWFREMADTVNYYHLLGTNNGYYASNFTAGNIKAWDNAAMGCIALVTRDEALLRYVLDGSQNSDSGIALDFESMLGSAVVEEWTGTNSDHGAFRIVDWYRAVENGKDYPEAVGYPVYHAQAVSILAEALRHHHIDYFHYTGADDPRDGDQRHSIYQPLERLEPFLLLQVPPEDNEFRSGSGGGYYYSDSNRYTADLNVMKLAIFLDNVRTDALSGLKARMDAMLRRGLHNGSPYSDAHIWGYLWPLKLRRTLDEGVKPLGSITGRTTLLGSPEVIGRARLDLVDDVAVGVTELSVPLDEDGQFSIPRLPDQTYLLRWEAEGYRSSGYAITLSEGQDAVLADETLLPGECDILPDRTAFTRRSTMNEIHFRYIDPDGWIDAPQIRIVFQDANGFPYEIYPAHPEAFEVVSWDSTTRHLKIDLTPWPGWEGERFVMSVTDPDTGYRSMTWENYPDA